MNHPPREITWDFLDKNPTAFFVFGDNTLGVGKGGAAALRDPPQAIGFITKVLPTYSDDAFYTPEEYKPVFDVEVKKLREFITDHPNNTFYISAVGGGLANKHKIFETIIQPNLKNLINGPNVVYLW